MPSLLELALAYTKAGISVIPTSPNKETAPDNSRDTPSDCSKYNEQRIATPEELHDWFAGGGQYGLAAVHGLISGGLECLDLVTAAVAKIFRQLVRLQGGDDLLEEIPATKSTVEGRTRLYYRCPSPVHGQRRLAQFELPSEPRVVRLQLLAAVHGEGSWTVLPGSPAACGDFNEVYEWVGRDLSDVPNITEDERQLLLESASCLNAWVDPNAVFAPQAPDGFDTGVPWEKILSPLGWKKVRDFGEMALWHTPGRTKPGYCAVTGIGFNRELLYIIRTDSGYTKFGAFASLYFGGDVEKARSVRTRPVQSSGWETPWGRRYSDAVMQAQPLVSCIMPTTGERQRFLPQAIKNFQRQTYPNLELVIVCDGEEDLPDLIPPDDKRVRYFYLGCECHTVGTKRNLACEKAKGDLIAHFDDDDWSHPDRLSFQVGALMAEEAEFCGLPLILFYVIASGETLLSHPPALLHPSLCPGLPAGASFVYRREFWSHSPFPDIQLGEDMIFVRAAGRQDHAVMLPDYRLYVAMIHCSNTCDYMAHYQRKSSYWSRWRGDLRKVMGADLDFYQSLRKS
jgi:hypothetical protein